MKQIILKTLLLTTLVFICLKASSFDCKVDAIYYNLSGKTAKVTYYSSDFDNEKAYTGSITIPSTITYNSNIYNVVEIGERAFFNCQNISSITMPNTIKTIGKEAFYNCTGLSNIPLTEEITKIEDYAFQNCSNLSSIIIPSKVGSISWQAFQGCKKLTDVIIDSNVIASKTYTEINSLEDLFGNQVESYTIGENVIGVGPYAFSACNMKQITFLGGKLRGIRECAFSGCTSLEKVIIKDMSVWCKVEIHSYTGSSPIYFTKRIFSDEKTEIFDLVIPEGVTDVSARAFEHCEYIRSLKLPKSLKSADKFAFSGCKSITSVITLNTTPPSLSDGTFTSYTYKATLYVPKGCTNAYKNAIYWKIFAKILESNPSKIQTITNDETKEPYVFNLTGQKLRTSQKGINIINGKKEIMK